MYKRQVLYVLSSAYPEVMIMKVVLHQIRHHLSILWWKILLLYGLEFTFLNFSDNFHCVYQEIHDYPKETDMSFLMLLFFVVPVLLIAFLQLYT